MQAHTQVHWNIKCLICALVHIFQARKAVMRWYISPSTGSKSVDDPFPATAAVFPPDGSQTHLSNVHAIPSTVIAEKVTPESPAHASPLSVRFIPQNSQQGRGVSDWLNDSIVPIVLSKSGLEVSWFGLWASAYGSSFFSTNYIDMWSNPLIVYLESFVPDTLWGRKRILYEYFCKRTMPTITSFVKHLHRWNFCCCLFYTC